MPIDKRMLSLRYRGSRDMFAGAMDKVLICFTQMQCKHLASSASARQGCS